MFCIPGTNGLSVVALFVLCVAQHEVNFVLSLKTCVLKIKSSVKI